MACVLLYLIVVLTWCDIGSSLLQYERRTKCPCIDTSLCKRLYRTSKANKELVVYTHDADDYLHWHWENITIVVTNGFDDIHGLMCYAHRKNTKHGKLVTGISVNVFTNKTYQNDWLTERYKEAVDKFYDVISFDIQTMLDKVEERLIVVQFVKNVRNLYGNSIEVSFNVPLCIECQNDSCDHLAVISNYSDFLSVEFCNVDIHTKPHPTFFGKTGCLGRPVVSYSTLLRGYNDYIMAGVPLEKIVMSMPWFAYDYACGFVKNSTLMSECHISSCEGRPTVLTLKEMLSKKLEYKAEEVWVDAYRTAYFNYNDTKTKSIHQVWFEDFTSFAYKYQLAKDIRIRGVALLYADYVDYKTLERHQHFLSSQMWNTVDAENLPPSHSLIHWNSSLGGIVAALAVVLIVVGVLIGMSMGAWLYKYKLSKKNFSHQRVLEEDPDNMTAMSTMSQDQNGL